MSPVWTIADFQNSCSTRSSQPADDTLVGKGSAIRTRWSRPLRPTASLSTSGKWWPRIARPGGWLHAKAHRNLRKTGYRHWMKRGWQGKTKWQTSAQEYLASCAENYAHPLLDFRLTCAGTNSDTDTVIFGLRRTTTIKCFRKFWWKLKSVGLHAKTCHSTGKRSVVIFFLSCHFGCTCYMHNFYLYFTTFTLSPEQMLIKTRALREFIIPLKKRSTPLIPSSLFSRLLPVQSFKTLSVQDYHERNYSWKYQVIELETLPQSCAQEIFGQGTNDDIS